ncbi:MAG: carbamoyltransferase HypF [Thermoplasmata archaeon]
MKIYVKGIVQGVGFRPLVAKIAKSMGLKGYVKNVGSYVEIFIDHNWETFLKKIKENLPNNAKIDEIIFEDSEGEYDNFYILESSEGYKNYEFPPDTAICSECLRDLFDPKNRRYHYPFTNCAVCGPRFSITLDLPYDRKNTSMNKFPMCNECNTEFYDIDDRRFNAQTISCKSCGPRYSLYDKNGNLIETQDPIREYAKIIDDGYFGVSKGWGGMHINCILPRVKDFRIWYRRPFKPFAIMVKDVETAKKYAYIDENEEKILTSDARPILLLRKKDINILEDIAPGLPYVGIYLPYSAFHYILFNYLENDAIVSTSANFPGEPMIIKNKEIFSLGADYYILHNLDIINRTDDSLIKMYNGRTFFIRKSRGYIPEIIKINHKRKILSLGAHMNARISVSRDGKIFLSQYLGDLSSYSYIEFHREMVKKYLKMLDIDLPEAVVIDKHPSYGYRNYIFKEFDNIIEVQHHHAHAISLAMDNSMDSILALTFDGTGYGDDGKLWGGELLLADVNNYKRLASLDYFPLPGNEMAIREPDRIVAYFSSLKNETYGKWTPEIIKKISKNSVLTSSMGRVLDALSVYLGYSGNMTYDGEPAMKIEFPLIKGKKVFDFPKIKIKEEYIKIDIKSMFLALFETKGNREDIAYSFIYDLMDLYTDIAIDEQIKSGLEIGITGGVSYSLPLLKMLEEMIFKKNGKSLILHKKFPPGDAGIPVGQDAIGNAHML